MWFVIALVIIVLIFLFLKQGTPEATIKSIENSYWKHKRNNPGLDEHQYLANVFNHRRKYTSKTGKTPDLDNDTLEMNSYASTYLFSVLPPPSSVRALALHMLYQEDPQALQQKPEFIDEYNNLTSPIHKLAEENPEKFVEEYKKRNPNMSSYINIEDFISNRYSSSINNIDQDLNTSYKFEDQIMAVSYTFLQEMLKEPGVKEIHENIGKDLPETKINSYSYQLFLCSIAMGMYFLEEKLDFSENEKNRIRNEVPKIWEGITNEIFGDDPAKDNYLKLVNDKIMPAYQKSIYEDLKGTWAEDSESPEKLPFTKTTEYVFAFSLLRDYKGKDYLNVLSEIYTKNKILFSIFYIYLQLIGKNYKKYAK